jgi:hypothetical protein
MVIVGFVYAWKKGTFDWSLQARAEARAEAKAMYAERKKRARQIDTTAPQPMATRVNSNMPSPVVSDPTAASRA